MLKWKWLLAAPIMGLMLTLAFAPYGYAYAALPALMFWYGSCLLHPLKKAVLLSYLFGLGLFGSGIWWTYISVHDFGGADALIAGLLTLLLVGIWALFPALATVLVHKARSLDSVWMRLTLAAFIWVGVEYLRGNCLLNGFPWLQIAYSQVETPLAGYAPVLGVYGLGFLLALSAFVLAELCFRKLTVQQAILFWAFCWFGGWGLKAVYWTEISGQPIKVTVVQGNVDQGQKWLPEQRLHSLQLYQALTEQHWLDSQVIIWPETAIPAFYSEVKEFYLEPLAAVARQHKVDLVVSLPTSGEGNQYFNSVLVLGGLEAFYHKSHLLPFGEYLPLQPLSGWILDKLHIPLGEFTSGANRQTLLNAGGHAFVTTICYEDAFGEQVIRQIADAAYIVNVTNDAWFGDSSQAFQHMQMSQMRALETGRYLIRATNTGVSGFVSPDGQVFRQAPLFTTTTLTESILPMSGVTPYVWLGDDGVFACLTWILMLIYAVNKSQHTLTID